jgi:phenylalanyl-tRNA synthetase beta chain
MIISTNWLSDYVAHGLSTNELSDHLTMCGLEVESVETVGTDLTGVVIGHVIESGQHPNADRLSVCRVDLGSGEPVQIVCGAPNVAAGQKVAVATVGTTLQLPSRDNPDERVPVTMKKAKIRGEESFGMICAQDELGLGSDHSGILVLDDAATIGQPFGDYLSAKGSAVSDNAIDIAITPNRPDAISHLGIARDIAALTRTHVKLPALTLPENGGAASDAVSVSIESPQVCSRYVGMLVKGVTVAESPDWMQQRLIAIGLRPRNNIVDITNYVMYECGQPLHAFDYDQVGGSKIIVRQTSAESVFTTLDSKERTLPSGTLMICDGDREVAIAGVMGGENSEVTDTTANVLIESAYFDPSTIRRTAKALGLQTDASYRFERGIDTEGQAWAAARAAQLMVEYAGGTLVEGMVDCHPVHHEVRSVSVRANRVNSIVGTEIESSEIVRLLEAIGFVVETTQGSPPVWNVTIPSWRPDVGREIDVIEEVARLFGFDNIPEPTHSKLPNFTPGTDGVRLLRERARDVLSGAGFRETYTNSMLSQEVAEKFNSSLLPGGRFKGEVVQTLNPITTEMATLRPSMLPGLLKVIGHNQNHGQASIRLFEFGRVHTKRHTDRTMVGDYTETETLVVAGAGKWNEQGWYGDAREADLFDLKGVVNLVLSACGLSSATYAEAQSDDLTASAIDVKIGKRWIGVIIQVASDVASAYSLRSPAFVAELDWNAIAEMADGGLRTRFQAVSRFPIVERDIAVVVKRAQPAGPMLAAIQRAGQPLLKEALVFDLYEGEHVADDEKSIAFGLRFGADRTLRDKDVDKAVNKVLGALKHQFEARLR